ncbi:GIY-YIG nuclease family protein [Domibacillus sp. A3M-37]|uniref:GIY-YIG nuclease family protein n=1 Tax=Domibacillus sp. A3M-37 TaxID=2962037 RepID=UPI0020B744D9|nr:GIY-YIG nuclease family protein [Domibacillus sp. A3M-37]MCP3764487.1 GIY-YIG nuclease family protein [Domibacillus sp. A3M-37]
METSHHFYVVKCNDGSLYAGYTNDLDKRMGVHNAGKGAKYTRARLPVMLIHSESFQTKQEAMRAEYAFKQLPRRKKEAYLQKRGVGGELAEKL